jgi:transposase InsO family protein
VPLDVPHAVWQIDHQDGLRVTGLAAPVVLQSIRAPAAGLTIGADVFAERRGAHAVPEDAILDALRRHVVQWGRPRAIQVDGGVRFLGPSQRTFPSRFALFCAGLGLQVQQIRPGRPTDKGAVERLHATLDGVLLGPVYPNVEALQQALDAPVALLNVHFPSRAKACHGQPPLVTSPHARHSGRP